MRRACRRLVRVALLLAAALLQTSACAVPGRRPAASTSAEGALVDIVADWPADGPVTLLGFREADGTSSPQTQALDEALLSAVLRSGRQVHPDVGIAGTAATGPDRDGLWPAGWRALPGPWVASGQLRLDPPWAWVRLALADTAGIVWRDARTRLAAADLEGLARQRQARLEGNRGQVRPDLQLEVHLVVRRDEGGFPRRVDWEEGGHLDEGDRVQLRLRVDQDCDLFVLLYRSDGAREVLHEGSVFAGRWLYVPGENSWQTLEVADQVTTLYVAAAPRLEEDEAPLWEALDLLQQENRVDKFRGLEAVDAAVTEFVARTVSDSVEVERGAAGARLGQVERLVYADGTVFESRGWTVSGPAVARAWSAEVRFR